eukprot:3153674-Prymnesium_polylepis.1
MAECLGPGCAGCLSASRHAQVSQDMWVPCRGDFLTHPGRYGSKGRDLCKCKFPVHGAGKPPHRRGPALGGLNLRIPHDIDKALTL